MGVSFVGLSNEVANAAPRSQLAKELRGINMKITKYLTLFLILALSLLILTSCKKEAAGPIVTEGLVVEFEPISIQEDGLYTIYDDEEFPLEITLKNKGGEDIKNSDITLELLGPSKGDFSGLSWEIKNEEDLEKISEFNPEGGEETLAFGEKVRYLKEVNNFIDVTWNVNYKYKYKTDLVIDDVCFKEDLKDPRVCTVEEEKTFSVSPAPITITSIREDTAGKGIVALTIELANVGGGDFTLASQDFDTRFNELAFEIDDPSKWDCKGSPGGENRVKIYKGSTTSTIRCKLKTPLAEGEIYTTPVKLTFDYLYQNLIQETLRIKETLE